MERSSTVTDGSGQPGYGFRVPHSQPARLDRASSRLNHAVYDQLKAAR